MLFSDYYCKNLDFATRYICPQRFHNWLRIHHASGLSELGNSAEGLPIYKLSIGSGHRKILCWTQMHGNESNSTHAVMDWLATIKNYPKLAEKILSRATIDFVLMLNPDGSAKWTRRNAEEIDLNRDFHKCASAEFPILKKLALSGDYFFGLNLHEQRTVFTTDGVHPATLSFLSPSEDVERTLTPNRKKAMAAIAAATVALQKLIPNNIARYTDEFYPLATGDNFMRMGIPNILIEGGHFPDDYFRKQTRRFYTIALHECLQAIVNLDGSTQGWNNYEQLPQNIESHYDIIYRNVKLNTAHECILDIAIQYREVYPTGADEIEFLPIVVEVGDCSNRKGWKEVDCTGRKFVSENLYPKLDSVQNFEIQ